MKPTHEPGCVTRWRHCRQCTCTKPIEFNGAVSVKYDEEGRAYHRRPLRQAPHELREFGSDACMPGKSGKCTICGTGDCERRTG